MTERLAMLIIMLMSADAVRCTGNFNILSYYRGNYLIPDDDKVQIGQRKQTTINTINDSVIKKPMLRTKAKLRSNEENYEKSQKYGRKKYRNSNKNIIKEDADNVYSADTRDDKSYEKYDDQTFVDRKRTKDGFGDNVNVERDKSYEKNFDFKKRNGRKKGNESNGYHNMFHKDEHYQVSKFYDDDYDDEAFKRDGKVFSDESNEKFN